MAYIPDRGDLVWIDFSPQKGHEQKGKRPALIISSKIYNQKALLAIGCPITSKRKGYFFEVILQAKTINGVILSDQVKSLDWTARKIKFIEKADKDTVSKCIKRIMVLIAS